MESIFTRCPMCGEENEIVVTDEQFYKYNSGEGLIQDIFPELPIETREMLLTGICPKCWNNMFSCEECCEEDEE